MSNGERGGFSAAERAWLDDVKSRWQPLTEPQAAMVRRHFGLTGSRIGEAA